MVFPLYSGQVDLKNQTKTKSSRLCGNFAESIRINRLFLIKRSFVFHNQLDLRNIRFIQKTKYNTTHVGQVDLKNQQSRQNN